MSKTLKIILSGCSAVLAGALVFDFTTAHNTAGALVTMGALAIIFGPALGGDM